MTNSELELQKQLSVVTEELYYKRLECEQALRDVEEANRKVASFQAIAQDLGRALKQIATHAQVGANGGVI